MVIALALSFGTKAQSFEPRSLSAIPTGGNFAIASYGYSSGNILLDNSLPITDLNASMNSLVLAYARSFKLFSRLAKFDVVAPYSFATFNGKVSGVDSSTTRTGFGDPMFRLSVVLIGSKAMNMEEFIKTENKKFNLGTFIRVRPPLGQYEPTKLINLGANRWTTRLGVAASYTFNKKIVLEGQFNTWLFTTNNEFYNGNTIKQKPLMSSQIHIAYIFKPGIWVAASVGRKYLGETILNGVDKDDLQNSSRYGAMFAYRLNRHNAIKLGFSSGISTRYGANFTSVLAAYQFIWFDKKVNN